MTLHQLLDVSTAAVSLLAVGAAVIAARVFFRPGKSLEDA